MWRRLERVLQILQSFWQVNVGAYSVPLEVGLSFACRVIGSLDPLQ